MPPYYSVCFGYRSRDVQPGFVARVYEAFFAAGLPFGGVVAWGCPADLTLEAIVSWNQERLERGFSIGFTEHVSLDYRQIYLGHPAHSPYRLLVSVEACQFVLLVPESDVSDDDGWTLIASSVAPLEALAERIWRTGLFAAIQTHTEAGSAPTVAQLEAGSAPAAFPFAFLDDACRSAAGQ
jgi:hypothetical protein